MPIMETEVFTDEVRAMFVRIRAAFEPYRMGSFFSRAFREVLQHQVTDAFGREGAPEGAAWAPLSPMRVAVRGSDRPVLDDTGQFKDEASRYKGRTTLTSAGGPGFSFLYPYGGEVSPLFWGLAAGQLVNPLGLTPLAATPRPLFAPLPVQHRETVETIAVYLEQEGFEVVVGE